MVRVAVGSEGPWSLQGVAVTLLNLCQSLDVDSWLCFVFLVHIRECWGFGAQASPISRLRDCPGIASGLRNPCCTGLVALSACAHPVRLFRESKVKKQLQFHEHYILLCIDTHRLGRFKQRKGAARSDTQLATLLSHEHTPREAPRMETCYPTWGPKTALCRSQHSAVCGMDHLLPGALPGSSISGLNELVSARRILTTFFKMLNILKYS